MPGCIRVIEISVSSVASRGWPFTFTFRSGAPGRTVRSTMHPATQACVLEVAGAVGMGLSTGLGPAGLLSSQEVPSANCREWFTLQGCAAALSPVSRASVASASSTSSTRVTRLAGFFILTAPQSHQGSAAAVSRSSQRPGWYWDYHCGTTGGQVRWAA